MTARSFENEIHNENIFNDFVNTACGGWTTGKFEDLSPREYAKLFPDSMRNSIETILSGFLAADIETLKQRVKGYHVMRHNQIYHDYPGDSQNIVDYYCKNGSHKREQYDAIFHWQCNKLYMRDNYCQRLCDLNLITYVDEMLNANYDRYDVRNVLCILLRYNHYNRLARVFSPQLFSGDVTLATQEYADLAEILTDFQRCDLMQTICDVRSLYEFVNYYFNVALLSVGSATYDIEYDHMCKIMEHYPLGAALSITTAVAQGDVADYGYMDLINRNVKATLDMPYQCHNTIRNLASSAQAVSLCADRMNSINETFINFVTSFVDRTSALADTMSKDTIITIVEVFIDFMSDLPNLRAVPHMRWITYISRILRVFIPDCIAMAINIFNTYVASIYTAVAQGLDDLLQTILVVITGTIALKNVPQRADVNKMLEYMKVVNLTVPFSKNATTVLVAMFNMLPEVIKLWCAKYVPEFVFYEALTGRYKTLINDIDRFLTYDIDTIYFNKQLSKEIVLLYLQAHELVKDMAPYARDNSGQFSLLREQLRKFDKLYESFISLNKCGVIRVCPFSLTIYGDSQIGKSTLSSAVAKFMFPEAPPDRVRYVIPTDPEEFWNGYSPLHKVTAEDDADQDAEYKNALQLFSIVTNAPYQPPMASMEDKSIGTKGTPYHSKMHIRCTNNAYPMPSTKVLTVEAYWKRRHMLVHAKVNPDYIIDGKVQHDLTFRHLEFYLLDPINPDSLSRPYKIGTLSDFLILLKEKYNQHMLNEERVISLMNESGEDFVSRLVETYDNFNLLPVSEGKLKDLVDSQFLKVRLNAISTYDNIMTYLENHSVVAKTLKLIAFVGGLSAIVVSMVTLYNGIFKQQDTIAEAIPSGDYRTNKYKKVKRPAYSEGTTDPTAEKFVHDVVRGRQCYVEVFDRRTLKKNAMCGVFICGTYILLPYHIFLASDGKLVEENSRVVIHTDQAVFEQMFESKRFTRLVNKSGENKDACIYQCTLQVRAFKDIRHHFINEDDLIYVANWSEAALNKFNESIHERQLVNISNVTNQKYLVNGDNIEPFTIYRGFQYDAITTSGDCGSVLVVYNTRIIGKILGIHVAGERNRHHGYSELVTKQMLDICNPIVQPRDRPITVNDKPAIVLPEGNYTYYGCVPNEEAVYPVTRTEIKPSVIQGMITPIVTKPVDLDRKHFPDTIKRFFSINMPINPQLKQALLQDAFDNVESMDSYKLGVVSEFEAINGNSKYKYFERMNMSTSPGLPYKKINRGKGKEFFFDKDDDGNYTIKDLTLRTLLDTRHKMAKDGICANSMWMDIPKDERRKPEKKVRMIITPPLDYQILFRMYFMDYIVAFYNNKLKQSSAVGINPYSMDWTDMTNKLLEMSDVGGDGDHTEFDGNMLTDLLEIDIEAINHYYKYEANHEISACVRQVLWYELVHTPTQCVNVAYCVHCGVPSGCNCTTIINTNANDKYYKLAWLGLAPPEKRSLKHFYDNVRIFCYGDDSIAAIKREVLSFYNFKTISANLAMYGIKFTMADKSGNMLESKPILDCVFLKNGFRKDGMVYHALMEEKTLYEMVNWIRDSDDDYAATIVNANMSLIMWYHYGVDRFEKERSRLLTALSEVGKRYGNTPRLLTYDYIDDCFRNDRTPIAEGNVGDASFKSKRGILSLFAYGEGDGSRLHHDDFTRFLEVAIPDTWKTLDIDGYDMDGYKNYTRIVKYFNMQYCRAVFLPYYWSCYFEHVPCSLYNLVVAIRALINRHIANGTEYDVSSMTYYDKLARAFLMTESPVILDLMDTVYSTDKLPECFKRSITAYAQGNEKPSTSAGTAGEVDDSNMKELESVADAITFIEQKPSIDIDKSISPMDSEHLMFGKWSIQRIFGKPQRLGTYAFTSTAAIGALIKRVALPDVLYKVAIWRPLMSGFTFMKYRPVFRIQLNGNKFSAGRLMAFIQPFSVGGTPVFNNTLANISGWTGFDHAFLDASSNDTVTLTAPWVYHKEFINIATHTSSSSVAVAGRYVHTANSSYNNDDTHNMDLVVFNPLNVGTGASTTIYATIFMHLEDVEMCVPQINTATSQGGTHSYITNNVNNWEKVASQTLPSNVRGDVYDLDADLKVSTLDKPNVTMSPEYIVRRAMGYMAHATNFEHLERMCLHPGGQSLVKKTDFGTNIDEMSLKYLTSKYTLLNRFNITTTQLSGTRVYFTPITPYVLPSRTNQPDRDLSTTAATVWNPLPTVGLVGRQIPLLSYVSLPFNFWGGSIKMRFDFVTNAFVTAKYYAAILYGTASPELAVTGVEPTSTLGYTFELNGDNKVFEIEIPYVADTPWKRVMNSQFVNTSLGTTSQLFDDVVGDTTCTGQVLLYVLNPLVTPGGLPTTYPVNVFIAGGEDFRLNFVSRANTAWIPYSQGIDPNPGTDLAHLGKGIYNADLECMSEVYKSVKDVLKRYCHCVTRLVDLPGTQEVVRQYSFPITIPISECITPFFSSDGASVLNPSNILNWYLALYRVWRGSLRFKIVTTIENTTGFAFDVGAISVDYMPFNFGIGDANVANDRVLAMGTNDESIGAESQLTVNTTRTSFNTTHHGPRSMANYTCPFVEIEVPFVYPNRIAPVPQSGDNGVANLKYDVSPVSRARSAINSAHQFGNLVINYPRVPVDVRVRTRVFVAVGDDFRAGCQMGTPSVVYAGVITSVANQTFSINPDYYN